MQFIFSTGSLHTYSIARCFELAQQAGFEGIELMVDHRWDTREPAYVQRLIDRYQLPVLAVHSPFQHKARDWADGDPGCIRRSVQLAEAIGAPVVVHHLPHRISSVMVQVGSYRTPLPRPWGRQQAAYTDWLLDDYPKLQANTDVKLCIENLPAKTVFGHRMNVARWNAHDRRSVADITRFPHITMDTTHLGTWGLDPTEIYVRWNQRVRHIHLSNFNGREHRRPENGHLRLDRLLSRLVTDGYAHAVSLELHPDALAAGSGEEQVRKRLTTSLRYCHTWAGR